VNQGQHPHPPTGLEIAVAAHLTVFVVGVSWAFGGNADWVRTPILAWGSLGILLALAPMADRRLRNRALAATVPWVSPVVVLNLLVAASCLTPGFRYLAFRDQTLMIPVRVDWWIPSATRTGLALRSLWLFDCVYLSCLNLALYVGRRRIIRFVLGAAVGNALALSVFGTVQKLVGSTGIYFGSVRTPHEYFFASFVYDNHWGAFAILMAGACVGLTLRYAPGSQGEGFFHGPAFVGIVAAALLAISVPMSGSRACTVLLGILLAVALGRGIPRISGALRLSGATPAGALAAMAVAATLAIAGAWMVAGDVIQARTSKTREQVAAMWAHGGIGSRSVLYHDTWRMARERILFGWGMGSYPVVFSLYNSQESKIDRLPVIYHDAHSDWLQSVAELGLAGTALIGAAVALPGLAVRRMRVATIPFFLLTGCILIAAYAWVEFPFGNVAVVLAWWLCFFSAIQYMRLTGPPEAARREPCPRPS
jgi:O-antigen ligase